MTDGTAEWTGGTGCPNWSLFPCYSIFSQQLTPNTDVRIGPERGWGPPRSSLFLTRTRALTVKRLCAFVLFEKGKETEDTNKGGRWVKVEACRWCWWLRATRP